jgi:hypothetical protein
MTAAIAYPTTTMLNQDAGGRCALSDMHLDMADAFRWTASLVGAVHLLRRRAGRIFRPRRAATAPFFLLGLNSASHWVIRETSGRRAGLFSTREAAIKYAREESADGNFKVMISARRFSDSLDMRASERWCISPGRWVCTAGTDRPQRRTPTSASKCATRATPRRLTVGFSPSNSQIGVFSKATTRLPGRAKAANFALT